MAVWGALAATTPWMEGFLGRLHRGGNGGSADRVGNGGSVDREGNCSKSISNNVTYKNAL
jgi:hypothetical protein